MRVGTNSAINAGVTDSGAARKKYETPIVSAIRAAEPSRKRMNG